jgi:hypothetical protein
LTVVALAFLVLYAQAATSSSSVTSSSSSKSSTSSSSVTSSTTSSASSSSGTADYSYDCTAGSDASCITDFGSDYCCYYSWYQYSGETKVESYMCSINPSKYSLFSTIANEASSLVSDVTASSGYTSGGYCANSIFIRVSMLLASLGLLSLFF